MSKNTLRDKLDGDELDLSMMSLTEVPVKEISALPRATKIDLSSNQLTSLPGNFATSLSNVTRLELGSNKIKELPENFYKLQNLRQLDLYNNQLTDLPLSFCQLPNLKWLDLKGNPLNPVLRKVAGDCLNQKECEAAARNIVAHLKRTTDQMEAEQQEKLRKQKEKEEAKAKAEEAKLAKKRAEKKAAKEKRKAETRAVFEAQKTQQANGSANTDKKYTAEPKPKPSPKHKKEPKASGWSFLGWVNLVLSVILVGAISAGLYVYTDGDLSPTALSAALPRIAQNTDHIARLLAESFQPDHLKQTAQSVGEAVSDTCSQLWASLEEYTGDLSAYTKPVAEGLTVGWLWLREHAILSYDWITNNVDWNSVLQAFKAAALFLYEQFLVACEELSKNQALMSLMASLRKNTAVVTDYLVMAAEVVWAYILQVVEYIQTEGPGILESVKQQAAGAIHTVKQSMEGLVK